LSLELVFSAAPSPELAASLAAAGATSRPLASDESAALLFVPAAPRRTLERVRAARQRCPEAALVVLGPVEDASEIVACARAGAIDWLPLPIELARLRGLGAQTELRERVRSEQRELMRDLVRRGQDRESERRDLNRQLAAMAEQLAESHRSLASANAELKNHVDQLGVLYRIGRELSVQRNWDEALRALLHELCDFLGADAAALLLFSRRGERLAVRSARGVDAARLKAASSVLLARGQEAEQSTELVGLEALRNGQPAACHAARASWSETAVPLRHHGASLGHLVVWKDYVDAAHFERDRFFLTTVQSILADEVATAQAMNELRRVQELHRRILDHVGSAVFTLDRDGSILFANRRAGELLGYDPEQAQIDAVLRVGGERVRGTNWAVELQAGEQRVAEGWLRRRDSSEIPVSLLASLLPEEQGQEPPVLLVIEDSRQKRALESERRRAAHQDELLIMAAEWAHDVRTPLTGILHGAELLVDAAVGRTDARRHFELIRSEVHRLDALVSNFLDFARPAHLKSAQADLRESIDDVVMLLRGPARERDLELSFDCGVIAARTTFDPDALQQVLLNLLTNAMDASPAPGEVRIRLRQCADAPEGYLGPPCRGSYAIEVEDGGPGVPSEHRDRLFIPFFTTKPKGSGLGLAISDKIARAHHGHLRYERNGGATIFRLVLPILAGDEARTPLELPRQQAGG
jgi:PAS domain S-box-containing protein